MGRKINGVPKERLYKDTMYTVTQGYDAVHKENQRIGQAVIETTVDIDLMWFCIGTMLNYDISQRDKIKKLRRENQALQKWLEGYIILLFAIVACFIIVVFVS